jgi:hypothetical protein
VLTFDLWPEYHGTNTSTYNPDPIRSRLESRLVNLGEYFTCIVLCSNDEPSALYQVGPPQQRLFEVSQRRLVRQDQKVKNLVLSIWFLSEGLFVTANMVYPRQLQDTEMR